MKKVFWVIVFLFPIVVFGQINKTDSMQIKRWIEVERLISIKNYAETMPILQDIKAKAMLDKDEATQIKATLALFHTYKINNGDELVFEKVVESFENEISKAKGVEKSLYYNLFASYLLANNYRNASKSDQFFFKENNKGKTRIIDSLFQLSIQEKTILEKEDTKDWLNLFIDSTNRTLTPTLYHYVAYNYINLLGTWTIDSNLEKIDIISKGLAAINEKRNFRDAESFLRSQRILNLKSNNLLWFEAIRKQIDAYKSDYNAFLLYDIANSKYRLKQVPAALDIIEEARRDYPNSPWLINLENLYKNIQKVDVSISHRYFNPGDQYIPIKVAVRNVDSIYIRVYNTKKTIKQPKEINTGYDSLSHQVSLEAEIVYEEVVKLKHFDDASVNETIYKLNPLPYGHYTVHVSNNKEFKDDGLYQDVSESEVYSSDVFISSDVIRETDDYQLFEALLINRKTGKPYAKKRIKLYELYKNEPLKQIFSLKTNEHGVFEFKSSDDNDFGDLDEYLLYLEDEGQLIDLADLQNIGSNYDDDNYGNDADDHVATVLSDRAIYRPGQQVFFKTILYNNHFTRGAVLTDKKFDAILLDANRKAIDTIKLISNAFGSADSSFIIPKTGLNGMFGIQIKFESKELTTHYIQVEEYKRPTFKVHFETNKETYIKKDTAKFIGIAEMLSGAKVINGEVRYKVHVNSFEPRLRNLLYKDSTVFTDESGKFVISIPLSDTTFKNFKEFNFQIIADVVNQTGELQSARMNYTYISKPWMLSIETPSQMEYPKWKSVKINTSNKNGQLFQFAGKFDVYKYKKSDAVITNEERIFFMQTGYHLLSTADYKKYFPNSFDELILDENKRELVKSYNFDTKDTSVVQLDSNLFTSGKYYLEAWTAHGEDTIRSMREISIIDPITKKVDNSTFFAYHFDKGFYDEGDLVTLTFQTDVKSAEVMYLYKITGNAEKELQLLKWNDGKITYQFKLSKEETNNNLNFQSIFLVDNKLSNVNIRVPIIKLDKQLEIYQETFRDKITPGQKETWSFKILQKDKVVPSEVLATMYDSSLDNFRSNSFPTQLMRRYPIFRSANFYYLFEEFMYREFSFSVYDLNLDYAAKGNELIQINNFNLWYMHKFMNYNVGQWDKNIQFDSENTLDEVVIVGYGTQKKESVVGAALAGRAPGIVVNQTSGTPGDNFLIRGTSTFGSGQQPLIVMDGEIYDGDLQSVNPEDIESFSILKDAQAIYGARGNNGVILITTKSGKKKADLLNQVQARTNLQETAFFYPTLYTNDKGEVSFQFDSPEALTKWKLLLFAHGKNLEATSGTYFSQTQKQLMVRPNLPRYFRESDEMVIKAQIQNLSKNGLKGSARIELIDPETNQNINAKFEITKATTDFEVDAENNTIVSWRIKVPEHQDMVHVKIIAANEEFSDGEQVEIPILSNKIFITDSEKIILKPTQQKDYKLEITSKDNVQAKVQIQSNPILEIFSALDYLKNYPYECSEQLTSKWFGLQMVQYISNHYPKISAYFKSLNVEESSSKLKTNSSLSELQLNEMPWLREIENDETKIKQLAELFNSNINIEIANLEKKILKKQLSSGGFSWFDGGKENTYISIRILEVFGKVLYLDQKLINFQMKKAMKDLCEYLDKDEAIYGVKASAEMALDYLFARKYWTEYFPLEDKNLSTLKIRISAAPLLTAEKPAGIAAKAWIVNQLFGASKQSNEIKNRLTQEVIYDEEKGMYWESNDRRFNDVSLHAYLVEAYKLNDPSRLNEITQWLFYKKESSYWYSTWMTVDAIYALLLANNPDDFAMENTVSVWVDSKETSMDKSSLGQVEKVFKKQDLNANKLISVKNNNNRSIYGGIYHQYFVASEDVKSSANAISVNKVYLVERNGKWIETNTAKLGEKVKVKITVINDSPIQYVHLKDSRPSGVEPEFVSSGQSWWRGYYFTQKDASTNYFFDYLNKGKFEYEYIVKTNNIGEFNSGITTISCMYDPTVNARSENIKLTIEE